MFLSKKIITLTILLSLFLPFSYSDSQQFTVDDPPTEVPVVNFFRAHGCAYCEEAAAYLRDLNTIYPDFEIRYLDVYLDSTARTLYEQVLDSLNRSAQGMPTIIIGDKIWVGFQDSYKQGIEDQINYCLFTNCPDIVQSIEKNYTSKSETTHQQNMQSSATNISIPIIGDVSLSSTPLFLSTLIIGFVDGFNPCSLWVLTILLSLTLYMQSRPKTLLIGFTFIVISAIVYALFISGLFTALTILNFHGMIQAMVSVVALIFAVINIKDYFYFKQGPSLSISDNSKPGLYQRMRQLTSDDTRGISLVFGTIVLSVGVSLVEFSCTAGFPIVWVNLLSFHEVTSGQYLLLLLLYLLIYMIDEFAIFLSVVVTMQAIKIDQHQGRFLKLLSGLVMLSLALIMLIQPSLMNNITSVLIVFMIVLCAAFLVDQITRRIINP